MTPPEPDGVPAPVLFNTWKHHAGALRRRVVEVGEGGETALETLPRRLLVIGTELMDLYVGGAPPAAIAGDVLAHLEADGRLEPEAYRAWLAGRGGWALIELPDDGSRWVVRPGDRDGLYVHLHPARGSPGTRRVRANTLKTAVATLACAAVRGGDPFDRGFIDAARRELLDLAPVGALERDRGLLAVLRILAQG